MSADSDIIDVSGPLVGCSGERWMGRVLRRAVPFGVEITVGFWLQGGNSLEFPQDRPGTRDLHRRKGRRDLAGSIFITGTDA